jgi:hypothetical protein
MSKELLQFREAHTFYRNIVNHYKTMLNSQINEIQFKIISDF